MHGVGPWRACVLQTVKLGLCVPLTPAGFYRPQHGRLLLKWGTQTWTDTCGVSPKPYCHRIHCIISFFLSFFFYNQFLGSKRCMDDDLRLKEPFLQSEGFVSLF